MKTYKIELKEIEMNTISHALGVYYINGYFGQYVEQIMKKLTEAYEQQHELTDS